MIELLDKQTRLTGNQYRIIAAAILGDMLEFFDYFLIGFVLAFIVKPWQLTFGQSAVILLSSGIGAMAGAFFWGSLADRIGRKKVFIATVLNFSIATGVLALTPDRGWIFLSVFRFIVGFGVGGLYCVDLPLVQEFVPTAKRGLIGGLVTVFVPMGVLLGSVLGAFLAPVVGWRGLFAVGLLPAALTLLIRAWVPESPRWLLRMGRGEEARRAIAWALEMDPKQITLQAADMAAPEKSSLAQIFRYPRSLAVSWLGNLGAQTGIYGVELWAPTLLVLLLSVPPEQASFLMIFVSFAGIIGRIFFSWLSDRWGRRPSGGLFGIGAAIAVVLAGVLHGAFLGTVSVFWLLLIPCYFFGSLLFLRQRRLRHRRPLRRRGLAGRAAHHRHGFGLRLRRDREDHRPARPGADRRVLECGQARGRGRRHHPRLPLSRRLVRARRHRLSGARHRDQGTLHRGDRGETRLAAARHAREVGGGRISAKRRLPPVGIRRRVRKGGTVAEGTWLVAEHGMRAARRVALF